MPLGNSDKTHPIISNAVVHFTYTPRSSLKTDLADKNLRLMQLISTNCSYQMGCTLEEKIKEEKALTLKTDV